MTEQDKIIKHISLIKFKDPRIVREIVYHPLIFAKKIMADPDDYRPIRIRYFGAFVLKFIHNKEMFKRLAIIVEALKSNPELYKIFIDPTFNSSKEAIIYVNELFRANDGESVNAVYNTITKAINRE